MIRKIVEYVKGKGVSSETIRYVLVGTMTTIINYSIFELMFSVMKIDVTISNVTSIIISILFAYVANKLIVFRRHCHNANELAIEFVKFVGSRLFTMALEVGVMLLFHNILGYNERICKIGAQVLVIITNYIIIKLLVFREEDNKDDDNKEDANKDQETS